MAMLVLAEKKIIRNFGVVLRKADEIMFTNKAVSVFCASKHMPLLQCAKQWLGYFKDTKYGLT